MPTTRSPRTTPADPTPPSSPTLLTIVDGWVRDPAIRAFALTILAMVLIGLALIVGFATGATGVFINAVLPSLMAKTIAGTIGTTIGGGAIVLTRRRRARCRGNPTDTTAPARSTTSS
jgi:hypothetical protein